MDSSDDAPESDPGFEARPLPEPEPATEEFQRCAECEALLENDAKFCGDCGALVLTGLGSRDDPYIGTVLHQNIRIDRLLGAGGMGRVYQATHLLLDQPVVVKLLHQNLTGQDVLERRFLLEARAVSRLVHPNTVRVHDFGRAPTGHHFMVMEYVPGITLHDVLCDGPLDSTRVVHIARQILGAIGEAHGKGIVHRDIKPANIMLTRVGDQDDFVKVLDFGLARMTDSSMHNLTAAGMVCGTPQYMAPEQASGLDIDGRADLYSLGIITYQMLTGQLPFEAENPMAVLNMQLSAEPVQPHALNPEVDPNLEAICLRALEKNPDARYGDAEEMLLALHSAVSSAPPGPIHDSGPANNLPSLVRLVAADAPDDTMDRAEAIDDEGSKLEVLDVSVGGDHTQPGLADVRIDVAFTAHQDFVNFVNREVANSAAMVPLPDVAPTLALMAPVSLDLCMPDSTRISLSGRVVHFMKAADGSAATQVGLELDPVYDDTRAQLYQWLDVDPHCFGQIPRAQRRPSTPPRQPRLESAAEPNDEPSPYRVGHRVLDQLRRSECRDVRPKTGRKERRRPAAPVPQNLRKQVPRTESPMPKAPAPSQCRDLSPASTVVPKAAPKIEAPAPKAPPPAAIEPPQAQAAAEASAIHNDARRRESARYYSELRIQVMERYERENAQRFQTACRLMEEAEVAAAGNDFAAAVKKVRLACSLAPVHGEFRELLERYERNLEEQRSQSSAHAARRQAGH